MKAVSEYFKSMYVVTIALLLLLAAVASYNLRNFPTGLVIAIAACSALDLLITGVFLKKVFRFPYSGFISGIIIGSIAPLNASAVAIFVAAAVAISSKYVLRLKGRHIFNPATLGLLVSLWLFKLGDQWWAAVAGLNIAGFTVPLTLLLIFASYKADKLKVSIPFLFATALLYAVTEFVKVPFTAQGMLSFASFMPYYFAFIMLSEPKTSPYAAKEQIVFSIAVALLYFVLDFNSVRFPFFIALLAGNLAYSLYRSGLLRLTAKKEHARKE